MPTLRARVAAATNDYAEAAARYRDSTGDELVARPFEASARPATLTRSATVLIVAHNAARSIVPALRALEHGSVNRTHPGLLDVVVVDDGSTDGTRAVLRALELDLRVRYVRQQRLGIARARNTALAFARGDVVVLSDADVVHAPSALEE